MSSPDQLNLFRNPGREITPDPSRAEPVFWFQELRLLRSWSADENQRIQKIDLHRGLNILWAQPEDPVEAAGLYNDGLAGHATGKTLFCRLLRFLLGEEHYGPKDLRDSVEGEFLSLWAVARIRADGEAWIIGRPVTGQGSHFAVLGESVDSLLEQTAPPSGSFADFKRVLVKATCGPIRDQYPTDPWRHLMPWLTRDQEARFSNIATWRSTESAGDNPRTTVSDQHLMMRAMLHLLDPGEHDLRAELDQLSAEIKQKSEMQPEKERLIARDTMRLRSALRLVIPDHADQNDFDALKKSILGHKEVRQERIQSLAKRPEPLELQAAREASEAAAKQLATVQSAITAKTNALALQETQQADTMEFITKARSKGTRDPARTHDGFCPNSIEKARERKCVNLPADGMADVEELARKAAETEKIIQKSRDEKARLESSLERLELDAKQKSDAYTALRNTHQRDSLALSGDVEKLKTCEQRLEDVLESMGALAELRTFITAAEPKQDKLRQNLALLRAQQDDQRRKLSELFCDVITAVMGRSISAEIRLTEDGLKPWAQRNGQLRGAALETIKTLAFDIASIVASIEGRCSHPRFLIHDGPREGDMSRVIYERFFVYVAKMEAAFRGASMEPNFQYILTTTTNPPPNMQRGSPWLLEPVLNSSTKAGRLLKEDF